MGEVGEYYFDPPFKVVGLELTCGRQLEDLPYGNNGINCERGRVNS